VPPDDFAEEEERPYNPFADQRFPASPYRETAFDEGPESPSPDEVPARPPSRWRAWLALCLQAVAWWLRRGIAVPLLATAGIALAGGALTWAARTCWPRASAPPARRLNCSAWSATRPRAPAPWSAC
jgi:hypothetical protein